MTTENSGKRKILHHVLSMQVGEKVVFNEVFNASAAFKMAAKRHKPDAWFATTTDKVKGIVTVTRIK